MQRIDWKELLNAVIMEESGARQRAWQLLWGNCKRCHGLFKKPQINSQFCSKACKVWYYMMKAVERKRLANRKCPGCGAVIVGKSSKVWCKQACHISTLRANKEKENE